MGHMGGLINPCPGYGQYRAGLSNTGGSPKPRKRAPCQKKKKNGMQLFGHVILYVKIPYLFYFYVMSKKDKSSHLPVCLEEAV